jgi:hypothetical protein
MTSSNEGKGKGKVHSRTGHEGPEGEQMYSSTLPSTSALDGVGGQPHAPASSPQGRPGTHSGGWVGPLAGLEVCGRCRLHRHSILGPSSPYRIATPTALRPTPPPPPPPPRQRLIRLEYSTEELS